jgi:hypothetical protein
MKHPGHRSARTVDPKPFASPVCPRRRSEQRGLDSSSRFFNYRQEGGEDTENRGLMESQGSWYGHGA